jgi:membrane protein
MKKQITTIWDVVSETGKEFHNHQILKLSAALAYYAIFSFPPLLIVLITSLGIFFGKNAVQGEVFDELKNFIGPQAAIQIQDVIKNISLSGKTKLATVIGSVLFIIGATSVFTEIQESLNVIWRVKPKPRKGILKLLKNRLLSFSVILMIGFLVMFSIFVQAMVLVFSNKLGILFPKLSIHVLHFFNFLILLSLLTFLFSLIFKILPDAKIHWKDVTVGAFFTTVLFLIGKYLITYYLSYTAWSSAYGAAGSVIILLLWVYYSSIILFTGAEFTQVYARRFGNKIVPKDYATSIKVIEIELGTK